MLHSAEPQLPCMLPSWPSSHKLHSIFIVISHPLSSSTLLLISYSQTVELSKSLSLLPWICSDSIVLYLFSRDSSHGYYQCLVLGRHHFLLLHISWDWDRIRLCLNKQLFSFHFHFQEFYQDINCSNQLPFQIPNWQNRNFLVALALQLHYWVSLSLLLSQV